MKKTECFILESKFPVIIKLLRIMKLTILLLSITVFNVLANNTYSQTKRLNLNIERSTVKEVLKKIEEQSEFYFMYSEKLVDITREVTVIVSNQTIDEILGELFKGTDVKYIVNNNIILLTTPKVFQENQKIIQPHVVSGKVTDKEGIPLPGVSIVVKGTTKGVITNTDGNYTINNVTEDAILLFSFIGMKKQEIPVKSRNTINVVLVEETIGIEEVVAIGYGTQKKVSVTGAVTSLKTDEMTQIPSSNISNLLAGRAPGVQVVNSSGFVGSTSTIEIRGKGSWNAEPPLFVVDNIIISKESFDALDPNEVESISFLKDAATSAIYGARSAGGVVLVTTKKGESGKAKFNFKSSYSFQKPTRPLQTWTALEELIYWNDKAETMGWATKFGPAAYDYYNNNNITGYDINDIIWKNPSTQQYNLSIAGGNENISYFILGGANINEGSYDNTNYDRYNFRTNVTVTLNDYMDVDVNISGYQTNLNMFWAGITPDNSTGSGSFQTAIDGIYRGTFRNTHLFPLYLTEHGEPSGNINDIPVQSSGTDYHAVKIIDNDGYQKRIMNNTMATIRFNIKVPWVEGLKTSFLVNYINNTVNQKDFRPSYDYFHPVPLGYAEGDDISVQPYIPQQVDPTLLKQQITKDQEYVGEFAGFSKSYQLNWFLYYDQTFGKHNVSAMVSYEQSAAKRKQFGGKGENLIYSRQVDQIFNTSSEPERRHFYGSESELGRISYIGRVHYEFSSKYIAEFSFRYDGSYIFAPENRWGFFPSGSLGWRVTEEDFFKSNVVSNLKLRLSAGTTGNDAITPFQYVNKFVQGRSYVFGDNMMNGLAAGAPANYAATWEKAIVYNLGLDYGFFNEKFSGQIDAFYRKSWDILGRRIGQVPKTYGAPLTSENYGEMSVKGIDASIVYKNNAGKLSYYIGANIGYAIDKVHRKDEPEGLPEWRSQIGHPLGRLWGYETDGIIRDQQTLDNLPVGYTQMDESPVLGAILHKDLRGENYSGEPDGKVDFNDMTWLSDNGKPRINYGINGGATWNGLSIDFLLQGVGAYDKMLNTINSVWDVGNNEYIRGGIFQLSDAPFFEIWAKDHWTEENTDAKYPRAHNTVYKIPDQYGYAYSDFWIRKGAYLRLKNLNIAYSLPKAWVAKAAINQVQLFFNGVNLFEISGIPEIDPELTYLDSYPVMKSYTFGINLTF